MKLKNLATFIGTIILLFAQSLTAEIKLPAIISSNMVLQRNTSVILWGWADSNEKFTIETSWINEPINIEANAEGNWRIEVKTTNSKESQTISFKNKTSDTTLVNILFGEVWLCSGQSNMFQPMKGYNGQPTFHSNMDIAKSANSNLRLFTAGKKGSKIPLKDLEEYTVWQQASPENVLEFSAVAYFFGSQLQEILDVPVGIIHSSWGGSIVEAWMSKEILSMYQEIKLDSTDLKRSNHIQTALFNAMIAPLIPYSIKGVLWYQGESNRNNPESYKTLFPAMVKDWRTRWGMDDFPFYYVQIAPYHYSDKNAFNTPKNSSFIREAQLKCLDLIPNSGIAITMDIGSEYFIHPPKKKEVADRLLFNALNQTYGYHTIDFAGPIYKSHNKKDGGIIIQFDNAETGLYSYDKITGFEIAGDNKVFYPATVEIIKGKFLFVKSDKVTKPVAVRYAWRNWVKGTLFDTNLLPASSFRTDNWDDALLSIE